MTGMGDRARRLIGLWLIASTLASLDLWLNFFLPTPDWAYHHRSGLWALGCTFLLIAVVPLTRLQSSSVTVGAGFLSGGVLGNLISGATDHLVVPNPLFLTTDHGGIAFNLADMFILTGNLILIVSLCVLVIRNRRQLRTPAMVAETLRRTRRDRS